MANVRFKNVSKKFDGKKSVVDNISFEILDKEFLVLVGPSGCGKSTTLRMIAGLEDPTEGEIFLDDIAINGIAPKDRDIAMVFQNYALYPHMTVFENMAFGLKMRKFDKAEIDKRVKEAAEILGLEEYLNRKPKQLSGGQRQRVAVGRAIVRNPKVFLFDEPLSNLDAKLRVQTRTEISKLHSQIEATMVYVTHDQTEAMTMGDRIVVMKDGVIQQIDTPLNLYNNPVNLFVAGFIGSPAMNFINGKISHGDKMKFKSEDESLDIELPEALYEKFSHLINEAVIMGVRSEDILLSEGEQASLSAKVEVVEPMGNETLVYFNVNKKQIISRLKSSTVVKPFDELKFYFDIEKILFFDKTTELRIK